MMKSKNITLCFFTVAVVCGFSLLAHACGFQAMGVTKKNAKAVELALKSITSEVEFNSNNGSIHFLSKERVTQEQVEAALAKERISDVKITSIHHN